MDSGCSRPVPPPACTHEVLLQRHGIPTTTVRYKYGFIPPPQQQDTTHSLLQRAIPSSHPYSLTVKATFVDNGLNGRDICWGGPPQESDKHRVDAPRKPSNDRRRNQGGKGCKGNRKLSPLHPKLHLMLNHDRRGLTSPASYRSSGCGLMPKPRWRRRWIRPPRIGWRRNPRWQGNSGSQTSSRWQRNS